MPNAALARVATAWAMLPMPTRPRVLPCSSVRFSLLLQPLAHAHALLGLHDVVGHGQHHGERQFGHGDAGRLRGVVAPRCPSRPQQTLSMLSVPTPPRTISFRFGAWLDVLAGALGRAPDQHRDRPRAGGPCRSSLRRTFQPACPRSPEASKASEIRISISHSFWVDQFVVQAADEQPRAQLGFKPGRFGGHDRVGVRHGHDLVHAGRARRRRPPSCPGRSGVPVPRSPGCRPRKSMRGSFRGSPMPSTGPSKRSCRMAASRPLTGSPAGKLPSRAAHGDTTGRPGTCPTGGGPRARA